MQVWDESQFLEYFEEEDNALDILTRKLYPLIIKYLYKPGGPMYKKGLNHFNNVSSC